MASKENLKARMADERSLDSGFLIQQAGKNEQGAALRSSKNGALT
jgi:hypothetical protein